jgi:tRNA 2-thiocytidine biosynthesis protein TtcA
MSDKAYVPADDLTKMWRAIIEFNMIEEGDHILIGLSGGKDSQFMTAALAEVQRHSPRHFTLSCYTMDGMFAPDFPKEELQAFCARYGLVHYSEQVNIEEVWGHRGNTPCFSCAYFRRAAMNRKARELGCNKIALAHHNDDAVNTLMLNLFHSGQNKTFLPVTYLTRTGITVIRPLLFYREAEIVELGRKLGLKPLKNPCPYDGNTQRQEMKELASRLEQVIPHFYDHMASALRHSEDEERWPAKLSQKEMLDRFRTFWKKDRNKPAAAARKPEPDS